MFDPCYLDPRDINEELRQKARDLIHDYDLWLPIDSDRVLAAVITAFELGMDHMADFLREDPAWSNRYSSFPEDEEYQR